MTNDTAVPEVVRRDGGLELPAGPKARRTRSKILAAAARCFGANGYRRTTMADVARAAGVSLGTVYQYFRDRPDLVGALVGESVEEMLAKAGPAWRSAGGMEGIRRYISSFVESYAAVAPMAGVWEEVSHTDASMAELRRSFSRMYIGAATAELTRAAREGLVRNDLDPAIVATALTAMVDRYCYMTYVLDPPAGGAPSPAEATEVLTRLWAAAIGLRADGRPTEVTADRLGEDGSARKCAGIG